MTGFQLGGDAETFCLLNCESLVETLDVKSDKET